MKKMKHTLYRIKQIEQCVHASIEQNSNILEIAKNQIEDIHQILHKHHKTYRLQSLSLPNCIWEPLKFCNGCKSWINDPSKHIKCKTVDN